MKENNPITRQLRTHVKMNAKRTPDDSDLNVRLLRSLVVDSSPRLLWCIRFLDVNVEPVDRITALVHRWFPQQRQRVASHFSYLQVMRRSCGPKQTVRNTLEIHI